MAEKFLVQVTSVLKSSIQNDYKLKKQTATLNLREAKILKELQGAQHVLQNFTEIFTAIGHNKRLKHQLLPVVDVAF